MKLNFFKYFILAGFTLLGSLQAPALLITEPTSPQVEAFSACKIWRQRPEEDRKMMCSGSLIADPFTKASSSRWVLSAAHCGSHPTDQNSEFFVSCEGRGPETPLRIKKVHRHPSFVFGEFSHDIALFEIESAVEAHFFPHVLSFNEIESLLASAQGFHHFSVTVIDSGISGTLGRSRFRREYTYIHADQPQVECAAFGYGRDENETFGHLQSQGLSFTYFLDLQLHHVFLSLTTLLHGVQIQPGDSGGPILCHHVTQDLYFILGVHSHSMNAGLSFSTPTFLYTDWILSIQSTSAPSPPFAETL